MAYAGSEKLVFSIDLGTTNSGISFAHLEPGSAPRVRSVTRWPGQEDAAGDSKLPTLVRYQHGVPIAFGADALESPDMDGEEPSHLAKWFKLHLHPQSMRVASNLDVPALPPGVALKKVYADFLEFLFNHAVEFFQSSSHDGARIWSRLGDSFVLVLATPNGWDAVQQGFLRDAVLRAGILPEDLSTEDLHERLQFVTEAEASVHFALEHTRGARWLGPGTNFAVLDAGGSTVDTTVYRCTAALPKVLLEEVTGSECVQAGSVFVNRDAEHFLRLRLANSKFGTDEYINEMMDVFEKKTKRRFDGSDDPSVIAFGRMQDNDPSVGISRGRITLSSEEVKLAFQNSLTDILASCERIIERSQRICDVVLLVGGYADSAYMRTMLSEKITLRGIQFVTVDDGTKKAAAEGATIWYTKQLVQARAVRAHFGLALSPLYKDTSELHRRLQRERPAAKSTWEDGFTRIGPLFGSLVSKHELVRADGRKRNTYVKTYSTKPELSVMDDFSLQIYAVDGDDVPDWLYLPGDRILADGLRRVCMISGDLSGLHKVLKKETNKDGKDYWAINYAVEVSFGMTALHAELQWEENGISKKSPLQLIPDSFV
ncbi:hypothetical protein EXIGLDRAFT_780665 [Exidia glandulosa HHB12029]|uniref:Actin-like ATPase domain-containing protein n=1 Tax=Exidia glandulosa HHB12029 TaxID=1314781 RepID=A0A165BHU0_EXIGL|nr:hypothetical protein EXIGLDRAFT_780665 [Exidia glandulosa HHB12029]